MFGQWAAGTRWRRVARHLTNALIVALAVIVVALELTVWRWLTMIGLVFARLPFFSWLERLVERLSPPAVVSVFVVPFIPLIPLVKVGELWLIRHHHFVWAAVVIVGGKVVGVAFATRVLAIARPKMLQVRWFAAVYGAAAHLLELGHQFLGQQPTIVWVRVALHRLKRAVRTSIAAT